MKTLCGMAVAVLGLLVCVAEAVEAVNVEDGNALLQECTEAIRLMDQPHLEINFLHVGSCFGTIRGMLDLNAVYQAIFRRNMINESRLLFCLPWSGNIPTGQGVRIIVRYLQTHPERLHLQRTVLAIEALREAFPCTPSSTPLQPRR